MPGRMDGTHRGRVVDRTLWRPLVAVAVAIALAAPVPAQTPVTPAPAQKPPAGAASASAAAAAPASTKFSQQELDQLLAPIALYPDALFAQVLMASTYPLEVVAAERWVRAIAPI